MQKSISIIIAIFTFSFLATGQVKLDGVKEKTYKTTSNITVEGKQGFLLVPENRNDPDSREIKVKFIHLKSLSENPVEPLVYLEGGGGAGTWQAESPEDLDYWLEVLKVSDLIFVNQRGSKDRALTYIWKDDFPKDFFVSEEKAAEHYQKMSEKALVHFDKKNIDVQGYNIEAAATDIHDLMNLLGFSSFNIYGFSFGSHIGMTLMTLFPESVNKAILAGSDAPNQSFNFPRYLDDHVDKLDSLISLDPEISNKIPDFNELVDRVMQKLEKEPAVVTIKNPLSKKKMEINIGPFGLALVLRLDIDDYHDIPVLPRLLYAIDQGDYSLLQWFVQKRVVFALGLPGNGINQQIVSGASEERWNQILEEASQSRFGNVVNFPFSAVKNDWPESKLSFESTLPMKSEIPTLFITGRMDCRTPVKQVEETMKGFSNAIHIKVKHAGHELAMWETKTFKESIPAFLTGQEVKNLDVSYGDGTKLIPVEGEATGHSSLN